MSVPASSSLGPSHARVIRTLKDGYWDRTEIIALADGSQRVRKSSKGATAPGPWSVRSLRREIRYLAGLPETTRNVFPKVLNAWDREADGIPDVGYEMPYFPDHQDAGVLARNEILGQPEIDLFQDHLVTAMIGRLHIPEKPDEPLSAHVAEVVHEAFADLRKDPSLTPLIDADKILLNGERQWGPGAAFDRIQRTTDALRVLDAEPGVRLHGDFFLENILWRHAPADGNEPRLILLDPVSVAGISAGPPVFDLVKYESYASGELLALRSAWVDVDGFEPQHTGNYRYRIRWEEPGLKTFQGLDWRSHYRSAFENKFGPIDLRTYHLIDGYFSVAMAVNTTGTQRRARLLKATLEFNSVLGAAASM
jgi:hypothetical protein